jgi:flagellar hook-length control protein FliK
MAAGPGPTPVAAAAPTAATATPAPPTPPIAGQLVQPVAVLRGGPDGTHTLTVVLRPETLGPVQVQVTLDKGVVDLTLRGAHQHGREALLQALPDLRRDLEAAGLSCSRLDVDRDTGGAWTASQQSAQREAQQQAGGGARGQADRGEPAPRPWARAADPAQRHAAVASASTSALDVLA